MAELTAGELALLKQRIAEALADERAEALSSGKSFVRFLEKVGALWIWDRLTEMGGDIFGWLWSRIEPFLSPSIRHAVEPVRGRCGVRDRAVPFAIRPPCG